MFEESFESDHMWWQLFRKNGMISIQIMLCAWRKNKEQ